MCSHFGRKCCSVSNSADLILLINGCCVCIFSILSCLITVYRGVGIPWYYHVYNDVICYAVVACKPQHSLHTRDSLVSQRFLSLVQFPNSILFSLAIYIELSVLAILIVTIRRMWRLFSISMCTSKRSLLVCCWNLADYLPPSCLSWIQQPTASSSNNTGCILISIQRVFTWTPEAISPVLNTTHLPVWCSSAELNTTVRTPAMFGQHTCAVVLTPIVFYCRCWIILFPLFQVLGFLSTWTMAMVGRFHTGGNQTTGKYHLHCGFVAMVMCIWMLQLFPIDHSKHFVWASRPQKQKVCSGASKSHWYICRPLAAGRNACAHWYYDSSNRVLL